MSASSLSSRKMDGDDAQRDVLGPLLEHHPRMLPWSDLCDETKQVTDVEAAVRQLAAEGLASQLGELIGATRAAARFEALWL